MKIWIRSVICLGIMIALSGCSEDIATPKERLQAYVNAWEQEDFSKMYSELSTETKQNVLKKQFVDRYKNIYGDFEISDLNVEGQFPENKEGEKVDLDEDGEVHIPITVKMDSMAGSIEFSETITLVKEERDEKKNWYVVWNTRLIFPQLTNPNIEVHAKTLPAKRGEIVDRHGHGLSVNGTIVQIGIEPQKLEPHSKTKLAEKSGIPLEVIEDKLDASWVQPNYFVPITSVQKNADQRITNLSKIPGVFPKEVPARVYPYGKATAHLTGYTGAISAEELKKLKDKGYNKTDKLGRRGLEELFEDRLRGEDGAVIYTTDANGKKLQTIAKKQAQDGEKMKLTINAELQQKIYQQMNGDAGTATAIDPQTGEVLALVSSPSFNPNKFILGMSSTEYEALTKNPTNPLLNRFVQVYTPGSAFKPITATIALKTNAIQPEIERKIGGTATWQADDSWGNYYVRRVNSTPSVNLKEALVYSDNIYFAQTALKIGAETFIKQTEQFGFGEQLPFIYPMETAKITNNGKFEGDIQLADSGYGQGQIQVNTLHLALTYTPFVTGGDLLKPVLEMNKQKDIWHENIISSDIVSQINKALVQVVESPNGTAHEARINGIKMAGKSGTAELKQSKKVENGKENGWFVAFDTKDPELLVAMMIEDVRERGGSHYVVPKVANVMKQFLKK